MIVQPVVQFIISTENSYSVTEVAKPFTVCKD